MMMFIGSIAVPVGIKTNDMKFLPPVDMLWPSAFHCENCVHPEMSAKWNKTRNK